MQENIKKFTAAHNTPYPQQLQEVLGSTATNQASDNILLGILPDEHMDPFLCGLLQECLRETPSIDFPMNADSHATSWRHMKEYTASGASGLHFGHFMANATDANLACIDAILSALQFCHDFCPTRWKTGVNVMLEKKAGVNLVTKLRTIVLFEPDFNHSNKRIGHLMLQNAELFDALADEQYGGRKNIAAIDQCFNKRITLDLIRQLKIDAAICSNDAKGCYDRIIHGIASLAMQRVGIKRPAIACMFGCLQQLRHYVCTAFGVSDIWDTVKSDLPAHGVGQGNGAGPAIWTVISLVLFQYMMQKKQCATFSGPLSDSSLTFAGYAYVNDTELLTVKKRTEPLFTTLQNTVNHWSGILRASGGALEPTKSFILVLEWHKQAGKWKLIRDRINDTVTMQDQNLSVLPLERIKVHDGRRALGVRLAGDGNNRDEALFLTDKCRNWATKLRSARFPRRLARSAFFSTIFRSLSYPLAATTFSKKEAEQITKPLIKAILSASGVASTFPRALVHAPLHYQGLNIPHLYIEQGISQIQKAIEDSNTATMLGRLLHQSLEALQLELGLPSPILTRSFRPYQQCITESWLKSLWKFLDYYNLSLTDNLPIHFPKKREHDNYIMEVLSNHQSPETLAVVNTCRRHLGVVTLSDIFQLDGKRLRKSFDTIYNNTLRLDTPTKAQWHTWNDALDIIVQIARPLGPWFKKATHKWWIDQNGSLISLAQTCHQYAPIHIFHSRIKKFHKHGICLTQTPSLLKRVRIKEVRGQYQVLETANEWEEQGPMLIAITWMDHIATKYQWAIQTHQTPTSFDPIINAIRNYTAKAVCDGSVKDGRGTAAGIVTGSYGTEDFTLQLGILIRVTHLHPSKRNCTASTRSCLAFTH